jgi:hypothetical protein
MTFDQCFEALLPHEGDFVDHPGGKTRFRVTERL